MNPTIFQIATTSARVWMMSFKTNGKFNREIMDSLKRKTLYGSFYRPGEIWDYPVFVCPKCAHATLLHESEDDGETYSEPFHCKYCYSDWRSVQGRGLVPDDFSPEWVALMDAQ